MKQITSGFLVSMLAILTAISSIGPFSSCKKTEEQIPADTVKTMAKDFKLKTLSGDSLGLQDMSNKVVVLFFFGYSCSYCKASAPEIQSDLVAPYASRTDYLVVALDVWDGTADKVESFRNSTGLSVPMLLNASGVADSYGIPNDRLVVIDRMGYIRFKGNQSAILDTEAAKQKVNELLAE
jgi:peroxiredoxin